jgi:hypothetical protein
MNTIPRAWLGFSEPFLERNELVAKVCMDCADKSLAEILASELGYPVTHGLCARHADERMSELEALSNYGNQNQHTEK